MNLLVAITSADRRLRMSHNGLICKGSNTRRYHASCRSSSQMITIDTSRAIESRDGERITAESGIADGCLPVSTVCLASPLAASLTY